MKYLDYPQFAELSRALTFTSSECTVFTRIEAYSCKPVAQEKPLYKHIQRLYAPEVAARKYGNRLASDDDSRGSTNDSAVPGMDSRSHPHTAASPQLSFSAFQLSSSVPAHLADSPFGNLHESSSARKLLFTVIATLNAAFPDHDFADIPVSTFRREPSPAYVIHSLSSTLQSLRRSAAGNNPDAPAAAAAATSPPSTSRSGVESSMAFFSAAPRTFAGLPASFDSSPAAFTGVSAAPAIRNHGSPSIAATLSPPGQMAQLSLGGSSFGSTHGHGHTLSSSSLTGSSHVPPAMALPPAVSNAQGSTFPTSSHGSAAGDAPVVAQDTRQRRTSNPRSPLSPRLGATSPRIGHSSGPAAAATAGALNVSSPPASMHPPAAINAATHPALASILDDIMCVEECEVYSFHPDIEYDPHASADDDEERLLSLDVVGGDRRAGGGLGLFDDEDEEDGPDGRRGSRSRGIEIGGAAASSSSTAGALSFSGGGAGGHPSRHGHDDLEDIVEQWGEDDDDDDDDDMLHHGRRGDVDGDKEMANADTSRGGSASRHGAGGEGADDSLLFDEDVYGQGLSGTQTPRQSRIAPPQPSAIPSMAGRPDLTSDTSSSSLFSSDSANFEEESDAPMGDAQRTPSKARVLGPADRSKEGLWGRPLSSETSKISHRPAYDEDDEDEDENLPDTIEIYPEPDDDDDEGEMNAADAETDELDAAGLLWATYAFFYNKRLKRVLFVNVWARTNAGVEAHAAAAAAAARARERVWESTSPHSAGVGGAGIGAGPISSSWPSQHSGGGLKMTGHTGKSGGSSGWASSASGLLGTSLSPAHRAISLSGSRHSPKSFLLHGGSGSGSGAGGGGGGGGGYAAKASRGIGGSSGGAGGSAGVASGGGGAPSKRLLERKGDRGPSSRRHSGGRKS
ncbi:hypothetical protein V8E36_008506 [Tilletia maclaganii]